MPDPQNFQKKAKEVSIVTILEQAKTSQEADGTNEKEKERGEKINHCQ